MIQLYPYQQNGRDFLLRRLRAILADDPGCGKTVQAIEAVKQLPGMGCVLVLCPAAVAEQWAAEIHRAAGVSALVVPGTTPLPQELIPAVGGWVVCPYSRLSALPANLYEKAIIADEFHYLKNPGAKRTKTAFKLFRSAAKAGARLWLLSGTPMLNRPIELAHFFCAFWPGDFGEYLPFTMRYCAPRRIRVGSRMVLVYDGASHLSELRARIDRADCLLRRTRDQVAEQMPRKTRHLIELGGVRGVTQEAETVLTRAVDWLEGRGEDPRIPLEELTRARQELGMAKATAAVDWVASYLEGTTEKLTVFCYHKAVVHAVACGIRSVMPDARVYAVTGDMGPADRAEAVRALREGRGPAVFVATIGACGVGLDGLQCCRDVVILEPSWVPGENEQAEGRVARLGGFSAVIAYWLQTRHPIDRRISTALCRKEAAIATLIG